MVDSHTPVAVLSENRLPDSAPQSLPLCWNPAGRRRRAETMLLSRRHVTQQPRDKATVAAHERSPRDRRNTQAASGPAPAVALMPSPRLGDGLTRRITTLTVSSS